MKRPFVVIVSGLPGSGKSYFAKRLANRMKATYLSSDLIRKSLFDPPIYSPEEKERVYQKMGLMMTEALAKGEIVVLDGTFHRKSTRQKMRDWIARAEVGYAIIRIKADEALVKERTSKKRKESDADYGVYLMLKQRSEPIAEPHLELISTNDNLEERLEKAINYLAELNR